MWFCFIWRFVGGIFLLFYMNWLLCIYILIYFIILYKIHWLINSWLSFVCILFLLIWIIAVVLSVAISNRWHLCMFIICLLSFINFFIVYFWLRKVCVRFFFIWINVVHMFVAILQELISPYFGEMISILWLSLWYFLSFTYLDLNIVLFCLNYFS